MATSTSQIYQMKRVLACAGTWQGQVAQVRQRTHDLDSVHWLSRWPRPRQPLSIKSTAPFSYTWIPNKKAQQKERAETVTHIGSCPDFYDTEEEISASSRRKAVHGGHKCSLSDFASYILGGEHEVESRYLTWHVFNSMDSVLASMDSVLASMDSVLASMLYSASRLSCLYLVSRQHGCAKKVNYLLLLATISASNIERGAVLFLYIQSRS
jgi:hypothetical protein